MKLCVLAVCSAKASKQNGDTETTNQQGQGNVVAFTASEQIKDVDGDTEASNQASDWQGQGNAAAITASEQIKDVDGDTEYYQKLPIGIAEIQSICNKGFCICGEFLSESEHSSHMASLTVAFNSQCAPVQVLNCYEKHLSKTTNKDCPCRCVVQINNHFLKMKVPNWPGLESDFYCLYQIAYQQRKTIKYYQFMERSSK